MYLLSVLCIYYLYYVSIFYAIYIYFLYYVPIFVTIHCLLSFLVAGILLISLPDGWSDISNRKFLLPTISAQFFSWFSWFYERMLGWFPIFLSHLPLHVFHVALPYVTQCEAVQSDKLLPTTNTANCLLASHSHDAGCIILFQMLLKIYQTARNHGKLTTSPFTEPQQWFTLRSGCSCCRCFYY
jgi:hypothetical protein